MVTLAKNTRFDSPVSLNIERDVLTRARAAVAGLRGSELAIDGGLSGLVNDALVSRLEEIERLHNDGRPFAMVDRLKRGRSI